MTLSHGLGSLNLSSRVSGTLPSSRLGSIGSQRMYAGTLNRPFSGGGYGSFGTGATRVTRVGLGSFLGTVSAHRLFGNYPGTWRVRPTGSKGVYYAAPPRARFVAISGDVVPTATRFGGMHVRQSGQGTIAAHEIGLTATPVTAWFVLRGWLLPNRGSYIVYGTGNGANVGYWKEWDP